MKHRRLIPDEMRAEWPYSGSGTERSLSRPCEPQQPLWRFRRRAYARLREQELASPGSATSSGPDSANSAFDIGVGSVGYSPVGLQKRACAGAPCPQRIDDAAIQRAVEVLASKRVADTGPLDFPPEDAGEPTPVGPLDITAVEEHLRALLPEDQNVVCETWNEGWTPRRENRAYVPTAQGNGLRLDWYVQGYGSPDSLLQAVEDRRKEGWRAAYVTTDGSTFSPFSDWLVMWVKDDDCNFLSGVEFVAPDDLPEFEAELRQRKRRPICIVHSSVNVNRGVFCIVWIEDDKYTVTDDRWRIVHVTTGPGMAAEIEPHVSIGFRAIWATRHSRLTLLMVHDDFQPSNHIWFTTLPIGEDPLAAFHLEFPDDVPICVESKYLGDVLIPTTNQFAVHHRWTVLGVAEPDVTEHPTQPAPGWSITQPRRLPSRAAVIEMQRKRTRILAFARVRNNDDSSVIVVEAPTAVRRFRCKVTQTASLTPQDQAAYAALSAMTAVVMDGGNIPALSVAVRDGSGFRVRAGFTYAPLQYEDTYPDSQFRVGSVSKVITGLALHKMLESLGRSKDDPLFAAPEWPADLIPSTGNKFEYGPGVLNVTPQHLLQHTGGWMQDTFFPDFAPETVIAGVASADLMQGWTTTQGEGLYPLLANDKFAYMLNSAAYLWNANEDSTSESAVLQAATGWARKNYDPASDTLVSMYSGFGYDLLARFVDALTGNIPFEREEFYGHSEWTRKNVLDPLEAFGTRPGRTARVQSHPSEVTYVGGRLYLEFGAGKPIGGGGKPIAGEDPSPLLPESFNDTQLFGRPGQEATGNAEKQGYDVPGDLPPSEITSSPPLVTKPYGHRRSYFRLEAHLPAGGWVSTAPDMCRLATTLVSGESSFLSASTLNDYRTVTGLPGPEILNNNYQVTKGGLIVFPWDTDLITHSGGMPYSRAWVQLRLSTNTRVACCLTTPDPPVQTSVHVNYGLAVEQLFFP